MKLTQEEKSWILYDCANSISLLMILVLGMDKAIGYQIGFITTAVWWSLLTVPIIKFPVSQRFSFAPYGIIPLFIAGFFVFITLPKDMKEI